MNDLAVVRVLGPWTFEWQKERSEVEFANELD